jgi:hypothetical protein
MRKDRNTNWRVGHGTHSRSRRLHAWISPQLEGEEGEEQFWVEGGSDADSCIRVEIVGFKISRGNVQRALVPSKTSQESGKPLFDDHHGQNQLQGIGRASRL